MNKFRYTEIGRCKLRYSVSCMVFKLFISILRALENHIIKLVTFDFIVQNHFPKNV